jgi:hypothetical protein
MIFDNSMAGAIAAIVQCNLDHPFLSRDLDYIGYLIAEL